MDILVQTWLDTNLAPSGTRDPKRTFNAHLKRFAGCAGTELRGCAGRCFPQEGCASPPPPRCVYEHGVGVGAVSRAIAEGVLPRSRVPCSRNVPDFHGTEGF